MRAPEPSVADVKRWRKLVRKARAQAVTPLAFGGDLSQAAKACKRATIPPAHQVRGSVFARLYELGQHFSSLHPDQRQAAAPDLIALADAVEAALRAGDPLPPQKDLFG